MRKIFTVTVTKNKGYWGVTFVNKTPRNPTFNCTISTIAMSALYNYKRYTGRIVPGSDDGFLCSLKNENRRK